MNENPMPMPPDGDLDKAQRLFIERLVKAGWVSNACETKGGVSLRWTPDGADKLKLLNQLLDEIEMEKWTKYEKSLGLLILWWSLNVGWDEENLVSVCGSPSHLPPSDLFRPS